MNGKWEHFKLLKIKTTGGFPWGTSTNGKSTEEDVIQKNRKHWRRVKEKDMCTKYMSEDWLKKPTQDKNMEWWCISCQNLKLETPCDHTVQECEPLENKN